MKATKEKELTLPRDDNFFAREYDETRPISWGELKRLQDAWFAIGDLAELLKKTRSDAPPNPCCVLRILADELGDAVTELEGKFEKAERGAE